MRILRALLPLALGSAAWLCAGTAVAAPTVDTLYECAFTSSSDLTLAAIEFPPILITNDSTTTITAATDLRLIIPATYSMFWDTADTTAEILVSGTGTISATVSYIAAGADQACRLDVTVDLDVSSRLVITGLGVRNWSSDETQDFLDINWIATLAAGASSTHGFTNWRGSFTSADSFGYKNGDAAQTVPAITVTEAAAAPLNTTATNDIRIRIPNSAGYGTGPTWDTSVTTVTITGTASAKCSTTVTYGNANRDLIIDVTVNFAGGDEITVSGMRFSTLAAAYALDSLQLVLDGVGTVYSTDKRMFSVGPPTITVDAMPTVSASAANENLRTSAALAVTTRITDTTGVITLASDIRLVILPVSTGRGATGDSNGRDNLTWTSNISPTFTVTGTGVVAAPVAGVGEAGNGAGSIANSRGRVCVLDVTTSFAAGTVLDISLNTAPADNLKLSNGNAVATRLYIGLVIRGYGGPATVDVRAFGIVVSMATPNNLTSSSSGGGGLASRGGGAGGSGVCFLRAASRTAIH